MYTLVEICTEMQLKPVTEMVVDSLLQATNSQTFVTCNGMFIDAKQMIAKYLPKSCDQRVPRVLFCRNAHRNR